MDTSLKRRDYHRYVWKAGEKAGAILLCAGITVMLAYFFYRSFLAVIPLSVIVSLRLYGWGGGRRRK